MEAHASTFHRLSKQDEDDIYALVESRIQISDSDSLAIRYEKSCRRLDYTQFKVEITPVYSGRPRAKGPMRLCYEHIPQLLDTVGLTYMDVFSAIAKNPDGERIKPRWSSEEETRFCAICDQLASAQRRLIGNLIRSLLPESFDYLQGQDASPIQRIAKVNRIRSYCENETARKTAALGVDKQYSRRNVQYSYNAIEFSLLPFMAEHFDISLHWLLGLDEKHCVLAGSGETELIMAQFCFLPEERKHIVMKAVEAAIQTRGAL